MWRASDRPLVARTDRRPTREPTPGGPKRAFVSHTTIYRWIWSDAQRTRQFRPFLRIARKPRRKPYGKPSRQGQIPGKRSIDERPKEANERQRLGDWEGDTMVGKGRQGYLITCVDRASRYLIARKVQASPPSPSPNSSSRRSADCRTRNASSLTLDNGREFARPLELEKKLDLPIYFAHPYHAWERGTNENTNGLFRQYLPKGTDLTQSQTSSYTPTSARSTTGPAKASTSKRLCEVFHPDRG